MRDDSFTNSKLQDFPVINLITKFEDIVGDTYINKFKIKLELWGFSWAKAPGNFYEIFGSFDIKSSA